MGRMVIVCAILAVTVWLVRAGKVTVERPPDCEPCEADTCEPLTEPCPAGTVLDRCRCCTICAQREHELCDHPEVPRGEGVYFGVCGENLECRLRKDLLEAQLGDGRKKEATCECKKDGEYCGTNNVTYSSICSLLGSKITVDKKIEIQYKGPCVSAPVITSGPDNQVAEPGKNYALACEAKGVPIPTIEWAFTRANGVTTYLPSDDLHVAVNTRGGPDQHEVTGWVQVMTITKDAHEGDYTCIAQNEHGVVQATARINVMNADPKKVQAKDEN